MHKKSRTLSPEAQDGNGKGGFDSPEEALEFAKEKLGGLRDISGWEFYFERETSLSIEAREGEVESLVSALSQGLSVRVSKKGRVGFSFTNSITPEGVKNAAERAAEASMYMPDDGISRFAPKNGKPAELDILDKSLADIPESEKVERAKLIESSALGFDRRVKRVRGAEYGEAIGGVWVMNSEGLSASYESSMVVASVETVAEEGGDAQAADGFETAHHYDRLDAARVGEEAAEKAVGLLGGLSMPAGTYPAVFSTEAAAGMLSVLAPAACGDAVMKGRSWLAGREGDKVAANGVTIVDDGLFEDGPGAAPFDDEGAETKRTTVIEGGVLTGFLYDLHYGAKAGTGTTGNGMRSSYYSPPSVDTSNWILLPGSESESELISQLDDGIYIFELMGLHTADQVTGEFSLGASGFRIRGGKIAEPVTGIAIAGTLGELLNRVEGVGDSLKFYGDVGSPAILVGCIDVSGSDKGRG